MTSHALLELNNIKSILHDVMNIVDTLITDLMKEEQPPKPRTPEQAKAFHDRAVKGGIARAIKAGQREP